MNSKKSVNPSPASPYREVVYDITSIRYKRILDSMNGSPFKRFITGKMIKEKYAILKW